PALAARVRPYPLGYRAIFVRIKRHDPATSAPFPAGTLAGFARGCVAMKLMRIAAAAAALACAGVAAAAPRVGFFFPRAAATGVRQIAARFTEPMVAFGDPRLPDPFEVRCEGDADKLKGAGRWADARNWVYDFAADLPAGQRCALT